MCTYVIEIIIMYTYINDVVLPFSYQKYYLKNIHIYQFINTYTHLNMFVYR